MPKRLRGLGDAGVGGRRLNEILNPTVRTTIQIFEAMRAESLEGIG